MLIPFPLSRSASKVIVHRADSQGLGRTWVSKLKGILPRQQYEMSIQAFVGAKCVASEKVSAVRKDVTGSFPSPVSSPVER